MGGPRGRWRSLSYSPWKGVAALVVVLGFMANAWGATRTLTIGIVPQMPAWTLARRWTPILKAWSHQSGYRITLRTAPTIALFEQRVAHGDYDLVYLNPEDYAHNRARYRAFARENDWLQGLLVVRRGGPVHRLADLQGQVLAFPARHALAASIEPRRLLQQRHIQFEARYVGSHDSVYRGVALGLFAGGGGIHQTYALLSPAMRSQLQVLWVGPKTLPHPFAARRDLPGFIIQRLMAALLHLPAGVRPALAKLGFTGFLPATDTEYRRVRDRP